MIVTTVMLTVLKMKEIEVVDEYPLPQHWASIRGHEDVAQFIELHSDGGGVTDGTKEGKVKWYVMSK